MFRYITAACSLLVLALSPAPSGADTTPRKETVHPAHTYVREHYDKQTCHVPMRDGTTLYTEVYTPKDRSQRWPILFLRTPYRAFLYSDGVDGYFGFQGPGPQFIERGYIFAVQDVRGRYMSEGEFVVMRPNTADWNDPAQTDESTDAWDTIDWLVNNVEGHNGRVGVHGISYPGTYAALSLVNAHPALKAALIEAPVAEVYLGDDYHHNGALHLLYPFRWINNVGLAPREGPSQDIAPPVYGDEKNIKDYFSFFLEIGSMANMNDRLFHRRIPFWNDVTEHPDYDDYWKSRSLGPNLEDIDGPAVIVAGSWFDDQDLYGTLHTYRAIESQNPGLSNTLVMGCWNHANWWKQKTKPWGRAGLPVRETGDHFRETIVLPFFEHHLRGRRSFDPPEAVVFETGTNEWRSYNRWPPERTDRRRLYLGAGGSIGDTRSGGENDFDLFVSDPADPVPHIPPPIGGWTAEVMLWDQRFVAGRKDVLVYQGPVLGRDLTAAGPVEVDLYVATTGTDADWVVKLIDVYPDDGGERAGYQMLIRGDIMRGRYRNSYERPEPFEPGRITPVRFTMPDICHTFRAGHRIMVQVHSSWFPMFDRNPQKFVDIFYAGADDFVRATHRVYRTEEYPSNVTISVLDEQQP
jgi:putative CocE/NonD family hydrolase